MRLKLLVRTGRGMIVGSEEKGESGRRRRRGHACRRARRKNARLAAAWTIPDNTSLARAHRGRGYRPTLLRKSRRFRTRAEPP